MGAIMLDEPVQPSALHLISGRSRLDALDARIFALLVLLLPEFDVSIGRSSEQEGGPARAMSARPHARMEGRASLRIHV